METQQQATQHENVSHIQFGSLTPSQLYSTTTSPPASTRLEDNQSLTLRELVQQSDPMEPRKKYQKPPRQADGLRYHCPSIFDVHVCDRLPAVHLPDLTHLQYQLDQWVDRNNPMILTAMYRNREKMITTADCGQISGTISNVTSDRGLITPMKPVSAAMTATSTTSEGRV